MIRECPGCHIDLDINEKRWNGKTICPSCQIKIIIEYDMVVMESDYEEWDLYDLKLQWKKNIKLVAIIFKVN